MDYKIYADKTSRYRTGETNVVMGTTRYYIRLPSFEENTYIFSKMFCKYCNTVKKFLRQKASLKDDNILEKCFPFCKVPSQLSDPNDKDSYIFFNLFI